MNNWSTDPHAYAALAKSYLEGAQTLNLAQRDKGRILFRPTLALSGHGLELLIKACFYLNKSTPPTTGRQGHTIAKLWLDPSCEPLRAHVFMNAQLATQVARAEGHYLGIPEDEEIHPLIEEYVKALSDLHGMKGYPLRYPASPSIEAPRTPLLVEALWRTADDLIKRSAEFKLSHFLNEG